MQITLNISLTLGKQEEMEAQIAQLEWTLKRLEAIGVNATPAVHRPTVPSVTKTVGPLEQEYLLKKDVKFMRCPTGMDREERAEFLLAEMEGNTTVAPSVRPSVTTSTVEKKYDSNGCLIDFDSSDEPENTSTVPDVELF